MFGTLEGLEQFADWSSVASNCLGRHSQNICLCSGFMRGEGIDPTEYLRKQIAELLLIDPSAVISG